MTTVSLRRIDDANRSAVLALSVAPNQEPYVGTVSSALEDAEAYPHANPWYMAIYVEDIPVGFVMISWNVVPKPPEIIGPWFLWKLLIDTRYQRSGYGRETVNRIAELVRAAGGPLCHNRGCCRRIQDQVASAAKCETLVEARGSPNSHAMVRERLMAAAVATCCR